jgi:vitamin B12 transporter
VQRSGGLGSASRVSLYGLTNDQIRLFMDGVPLGLAGFGAGIHSVPLNWVDRIDIYRGVVPMSFAADALGGAIDLVTSRARRRSSLGATATAGAFDTYGVSVSGAYAGRNRMFARAAAFADSSANDYTVTAEVSNEVGRLGPRLVRRFHDGYRALGAVAESTTGWAHRSWSAPKAEAKCFRSPGI